MKKALLIVDMSNDFVADEGGLTVGRTAQDVVPFVHALASLFCQEGEPVVLTMDAHASNDPHFQRWPVHNVVGTWGQQPYGSLGDLLSLPGVVLHPKESYDAFHDGTLTTLLRSLGVEEVHVVGVCTDICVFLTVAGADAAGFKTVVHSRGCATFTLNGQVFLEHMRTCFHTDVREVS